MSLLDEITRLAREEGGDALLELTVSSRQPLLYDQAIEEYGSWDGALAAVIVGLVQPRTRSTSTIQAREEEVVRKASSAAKDPLFTQSTDGGFFWIDGSELEITDAPEILPAPAATGPIRRMWSIGDPDGVFVFSSEGRYYGLITRVVPQWMGDSPLRPFSSILPHLNAGEFPMLVLPRRAGGGGRIVHVTREGKGKATDASEYGRLLDQSGREAFLLNAGDVPVAVMSGPEDATIFCASAMGLGIHFEGADMRSMGRKAVGVNVMKLEGADDHIVNAFVGNDVQQVAVVTASGLAKRIWFDDFRTQGRGGAGMQVTKLAGDDRVVGVVPCVSESDLVITTNKSRVWRTEATTFELMGRPARGNQLFSLVADERIIGLSVLPTSTSNFGA